MSGRFCSAASLSLPYRHKNGVSLLFSWSANVMVYVGQHKMCTGLLQRVQSFFVNFWKSPLDQVPAEWISRLYTGSPLSLELVLRLLLSPLETCTVKNFILLTCSILCPGEVLAQRMWNTLSVVSLMTLKIIYKPTVFI